jgi:CRP-like cAMP-binding protein
MCGRFVSAGSPDRIAAYFDTVLPTEVVAESLGEMSTVLGRPATATVRAMSDCTVLQADDGAAFLRERPDVLLDVAKALAARLDNLTGHLTDVKRQYGGDAGHLGMLDDVLSTLLHHQTKAVTPGSARMPDLDY